MQLRALASDSDGSITRVQFYEGTNLIGNSSSAPYTNVFYTRGYAIYTFTAVAIDNFGAATTSAPVRIEGVQVPTEPYFIITAPTNQTVFIAPATFEFKAFALTIDGFDKPVEFLFGTNVVGTLTDAPYALTISNVLEGTFSLCARAQTNATYRQQSICQPIEVTVASLALHSAQLETNGTFEFVAAGNIRDKRNYIEVSVDLLNWLPLQTNLPSTTSFLFLDPEATNYSRRFYRVRLEP